MKAPLGRLWLLLFFIAANGAKAGEATPVRPLGDGTYSVTVKATAITDANWRCTSSLTRGVPLPTCSR